MAFSTVYCIDGSGNKDEAAGDRKRPIYRLEVATGEITRALPKPDQTALEFFIAEIERGPAPSTTLIAADLPIGLPVAPADVYASTGSSTFLEWLQHTEARLRAKGTHWRDGLIARGIASRSADMPFVSLAKGDKKHAVAAYRHCDTASRAESIYCVDHSAKQVGKSALQFWFEILMPLRAQFGDRLAVWPFEPLDGKDIVVGECYPAICQHLIYGRKVRKRIPLNVAAALKSVANDPARCMGISVSTWIHASSSEDEFDMFSTALAMREHSVKQADLLWFPPDKPECATLEGWMLGFSGVLPAPVKVTRKARRIRSGISMKSAAVAVGAPNRHNQLNLGPSGNRGSMGPLHKMKCQRRLPDGTLCGHEYETNAQDVFQKRCAVCQKK